MHIMWVSCGCYMYTTMRSPLIPIPLSIIRENANVHKIGVSFPWQLRYLAENRSDFFFSFLSCDKTKQLYDCVKYYVVSPFDFLPCF